MLFQHEALLCDHFVIVTLIAPVLALNGVCAMIFLFASEDDDSIFHSLWSL